MILVCGRPVHFLLIAFIFYDVYIIFLLKILISWQMSKVPIYTGLWMPMEVYLPPSPFPLSGNCLQYTCTVRAPVFGRHQFFGTSEHYGKAHGSLLYGWMNYNYTACCWFPTSSNILKLPSQFWQIRFESYWLHCSAQSAEYWCFYGTTLDTLDFE